MRTRSSVPPSPRFGPGFNGPLQLAGRASSATDVAPFDRLLVVTARTSGVASVSGPVGTPITITYSGLGSTLYTGGASLLYDNHYVGEMMANWTRGTARVVIRAAGAVGKHTIQVGNAISYMYLNVPQSPIPPPPAPPSPSR